MKTASTMDPAVGGLSGGALGVLGPILYGAMSGEPGRGARAGGRALLEGAAGGAVGLAASAGLGKATGANALSQIMLNRGLGGVGAVLGGTHGAYRSLKNTEGKAKQKDKPSEEKEEKPHKKKASTCLMISELMRKQADDMDRNMQAVGRSGVESHVGMLAGLAGLPFDLHRNAKPENVLGGMRDVGEGLSGETIKGKATKAQLAEVQKTPFAERALIGTLAKGGEPLARTMGDHGAKVKALAESIMKESPKLLRHEAMELAGKQIARPGITRVMWDLTKGHFKATPIAAGLAAAGGIAGGIHGWHASKQNSRPWHEKLLNR